MNRFFIIFYFLFFSAGFAQNVQKIDSLRKLLKYKTDTAAVNCINAIGKEFLAVNTDSTLQYSNIALQRSEKINFPFGQARALLIKAAVYRKKGIVDSAMALYSNVVHIADKHGLRQENGEANMLMGFMLQNQGEYDKSLSHLIAAEKHFSEIGNKLFLGRNNWMMGNTYLKLKSYNESEKSFNRAKGFFGEIKDSLGYFDCVLNTAIIYIDQSQFEKALQLINSSENFYRKVKHKGALSAALVNKSETLIELNRFDEAEKAIAEALELKTALGTPAGIAYCLSTMGHINVKRKAYAKAEEFFLKAIEFARKDNSQSVVLSIYKALYLMHKEKKDLSLALNYHEKYMALNDSIYNSEKNKTIEEMKTRFETEKKDKELLKKDAELVRQEAESKQKSLQRNVLIVGLLLSLLLAGFVLKSLNEKRKANKIILEQKHLVEEKQKEILDSINYAKRIQYTLLAHDQFINANLKDYFIFFNPKDIVSGDFYWATKKENRFYMAVCDSTGHGVPGAFMSLLNISFLNEAINERNILEPHKIFDYVRQRLVDSISKEGQQDGFDGILLCIDGNTGGVTYAAGNNTPVLVSASGYEELMADRMPIGISDRSTPFNLYTIDSKKNGTLYLYTDGFADQFGGAKGKKFKYRQLNELLVSISDKNLKDQKQLLNESFLKWKGNLEQVDDICVMGIRLPDSSQKS